MKVALNDVCLCVVALCIGVRARKELSERTQQRRLESNGMLNMIFIKFIMFDMSYVCGVGPPQKYSQSRHPHCFTRIAWIKKQTPKSAQRMRGKRGKSGEINMDVNRESRPRIPQSLTIWMGLFLAIVNCARYYFFFVLLCHLLLLFDVNYKLSISFPCGHSFAPDIISVGCVSRLGDVCVCRRTRSRGKDINNSVLNNCNSFSAILHFV